MGQIELFLSNRKSSICRGRPKSLSGPSGVDQRETQDGCQNGQLWLAARLNPTEKNKSVGAVPKSGPPESNRKSSIRKGHPKERAA